MPWPPGGRADAPACRRLDLMARELRLEAAEAHPPAGDVDLSAVELDVYDGRDGWWNPQHDVVDVPEDWEFLTTGQAFVTRTVKAGGVFWLAWAPRSRTWRHRRLLGWWAPGASIASAEHADEATKLARESRRDAGARSRARQEARYQAELAEAIVNYLAFSPDHQALAQSIAASASARSGRGQRPGRAHSGPDTGRTRGAGSASRDPARTHRLPPAARRAQPVRGGRRPLPRDQGPKPTTPSTPSSTPTVNNCPDPRRHRAMRPEITGIYRNDLAGSPAVRRR